MPTRISSQMYNNDTQKNLRSQESRLNRANNQIGSQERLQTLREDPLAAGHLVRYQSYLTRVNTFEKNALTLTDEFALREGYMEDSLGIMQRIRELAVEGANGIYGREDLKNMAAEVDELLQALILCLPVQIQNQQLLILNLEMWKEAEFLLFRM